MREQSSWSVLPQAPNIIAPKQSGLTSTPVRPSMRYPMGANLPLWYRLQARPYPPAPHKKKRPHGHARVATEFGLVGLCNGTCGRIAFSPQTAPALPERSLPNLETTTAPWRWWALGLGSRLAPDVVGHDGQYGV